MRRSFIARAALAIAVVALPGCAAEPAPTPTSIASASPPPTVTAGPDRAAPSSRLGLECEELVNAETVVARIPGAVPRADYFADVLAQGAVIPEGTPILQNGGLVCDWSAVTSTTGGFGLPTGYTGMHIELLPDASASWAVYTASIGLPSSGYWYCFADGGAYPTFCNFESLVGTTWVSITMSGIDEGSTTSDETLAANVRPFVDEIVAVIAAADAAEPAWSDPDAIAPPATCEAIVPISAVAAATRTTGLSSYDTAHGPYGDGYIGLLRTAAGLAISQLDCPWGYGFEGAFGGMNVIPGGVWALQQTIDDDSPSGPARRLTLDGLGPDDGAWLRCSNDSAICVLDLSVGRNWVSLWLWDAVNQTGTPVGEDRQGVLEALAVIAIDNLR
jgi:hypothetical protein